MARLEVDNFFEKIPAKFADPITGAKPWNEIELTGILTWNLLNNLINWDRVGIYKHEHITGKTLFDKKGTIISEYPLFCKNDAEIKRWGAMRSDLLFISNDRQDIILIEGKVDGPSTKTAFDYQIGRLSEFLSSLIIKNKSIIIICPEFNSPWYFERLDYNMNKFKKLNGYLLFWEDIFQAI